MSKINNRKILDIDTDSSFEIYEKKKDSKKDDKKNSKKNSKKIKYVLTAIKDSNYVRPEITYTDKLSKKEIESMLLEYEKVVSLEDVPIGTHLRYFEDKDGIMKFRTGGVLTIKTGLPEYCILYNNKVSWSVQVKKCVFFRKISVNEIKKEYEILLEQKKKELDEKDRKIAELHSYIRKLNENNIALKKKLRLK